MLNKADEKSGIRVNPFENQTDYFLKTPILDIFCTNIATGPAFFGFALIKVCCLEFEAFGYEKQEVAEKIKENYLLRIMFNIEFTLEY